MLSTSSHQWDTSLFFEIKSGLYINESGRYIVHPVLTLFSTIPFGINKVNERGDEVKKLYQQAGPVR